MQTQIYTYTHRYTDLSWHKLVLCLIKMIQPVWQGQSTHLLLPNPSSPISIYAFHGRWCKMIVFSKSVFFKQSTHTFVALSVDFCRTIDRSVRLSLTTKHK